ncbi:uncharacterized protein LOC129271021 [Lytechinus pictus]|uniref:uncharacterized protein LOC129271021 n=1 Tax=Lytechinus pictus TaxID=7653 RepID=UPI0030B9CAA1
MDANMESRLGYSVLRNFDYSHPFEEGVLNRGRQYHNNAHIHSKTCLDLFLPTHDLTTTTSESEAVSSDRRVSEGSPDTGCKGSTSSLDSKGIPGGIDTLIKDQRNIKSEKVESTASSCAPDLNTIPNDPTSSDEIVKQRDVNGAIRGKRPRPPPLVVFAYGGGWRRGDKQTWRHYISRWECNFSLAALVGCDRLYSNIGESFASQGFPCAVLSYPISPTPWLIHLIEMAISLAYALAYWILAAIFLLLVFEVLPMDYFWGISIRVPAIPLIAGVITVSQWITLAIMISRELYLDRQHRSDKSKTMSLKMPICIALAATIAMVSRLNIYTLAENNVLSLVVSGILLLAVQCLIFYFRQSTTFDLGPKLVTTAKGQVECISLALRWLVDYGRSTGHFDPESLVLMGHSAGGHLVTLIALDHHYLTNVGISPDVIKGVITLSAVHDLLSISKGFFYHIYLKPAFGTDPSYWATMSPIEYVKQLDENENAPSATSQSSSSKSSVGESSSASSSLSTISLSSTTSTSSSPPSSSSSSPPLSSSSSPSPSTLSPAFPTSQLPVKPASPSQSQIQMSSSSASSSSSSSSLPPTMAQTPLPAHRPHFLIISPAQDFVFMIKDADRMCSVLTQNGYTAHRNLIQGCGHFNMVRKFGCPWYRYWTGVLRQEGGWAPTAGELMCWEFVQQFWNKENNTPQ